MAKLTGEQKVSRKLLRCSPKICNDTIPGIKKVVYRVSSHHPITGGRLVLCSIPSSTTGTTLEMTSTTLLLHRLWNIRLGNLMLSCPTHVMASGHRIVRVNAFHPSFAMNYNPDLSCLRQLLILEVAQACGLYRGDWLNKRWMDELRERCKSITRERSRAQEM